MNKSCIEKKTSLKTFFPVETPTIFQTKYPSNFEDFLASKNHLLYHITDLYKY
jgi:hypothetical protein